MNSDRSNICYPYDSFIENKIEARNGLVPVPAVQQAAPAITENAVSSTPVQQVNTMQSVPVQAANSATVMISAVAVDKSSLKQAEQLFLKAYKLLNSISEKKHNTDYQTEYYLSLAKCCYYGNVVPDGKGEALKWLEKHKEEYRFFEQEVQKAQELIDEWFGNASVESLCSASNSLSQLVSDWDDIYDISANVGVCVGAIKSSKKSAQKGNTQPVSQSCDIDTDLVELICSDFLAYHPDSRFTNTPTDKLVNGLGLKGEIYIAFDSTVFGTGKNGFAITSRGIYFCDMFSKSVFYSYSELSQCGKFVLRDSNIEANGVRVAYISGESNEMKQAVLELFNVIFGY